jgi:putative transposase
MFAVLDISKRTYYKYRNSEDKDYFDYLLIKEIFEDSKNTYGYRRICEGLLIKYGVIFNHKKVARIMKKYYLKPEYIKRIRPNISYKRIEENVKPNLLKRNFNSNSPNKVWTTDITYLIFNNKRLYLSTILDLYDRKIVAYKISKFNDNQLVIDTLNEAIAKRKNVYGTIIHSDQGFQYTSFEYKVICEANGIQISMSRKGTPIDDSPMESFHGILKKETLYNNDIKSINEYQALVEDWLEFYNTTRLKNRKKHKISSS